MCTLRLRGDEKFRNVFVALSNDDDKKVIVFLQGFNRLINNDFNTNINNNVNNFVLFNPNEGKGKTFKRTKKCIEMLVIDNDYRSVEDIYENCVIECEDFDEDLGDAPLRRLNEF